MAMHVSCQGCKHAVQDAPYGIPAACCACKAYDGWTPVDPPTQGSEADPRYDESTTPVDSSGPGRAGILATGWAGPGRAGILATGWAGTPSETESASRCAAPIKVDPGGGVSPDPSADAEAAVGSVDSKIAHGSQKSEPFRRALTDVWRVSLFGERKHGANNWQSAKPDGMHFYEDALWRHLQARRMGEVCADDSGLPHLAHLAWNALMLLEMESRGVTNPEWGPSPEGSNDP